MPLEHARRERLDGGAVADVAELDLAADLVGERSEPAPRAARRGRSASPRAASARAVASPMPDDAPVTTAIRCTASTLQSALSASPQPSLRARRYSAPSRFDTVRRSSPAAVQRSSTTCPGRGSGRRITRASGARWCDAAEDDVRELLVLEAALGSLREAVRPAAGEAGGEVAPVARGQRAGLVVRAGGERRAAGRRSRRRGRRARARSRRSSPARRSRACRPRATRRGRRSRGAPPARARRSRRRRPRDRPALRRRRRRDVVQRASPQRLRPALGERASRRAPSPALPRRA